MSSRYSICVTADQLASRFSIEVSPAYKPRYNASPTQLLPVITNTGSQGLSFFYWGLPPQQAGNKPLSEKVLHVQAEKIPEKPVYRKMLAQRRCLIPADGFYEWKKIGKKTSIPYRYVLQKNEVFSIAGLWEEYENEEGEQFHTFSMITCPSNELVAMTFERMPAILHRDLEREWLSGAAPGLLEGMLKAFDPGKMDGYTVSPRISQVDADDASLIRPAPPADQYGNLTLFD